MGKPHPLLTEIENDEALGRDERDFIVDFLRKRIKKPAHRPPKSPRERNEVAITVLRYEFEHRCKREAAVAEAQEKHRVSRKTVFRALKASSRPVGYRCMALAGTLTVEIQTPDHHWRRVPEDWQIEDVLTF